MHRRPSLLVGLLACGALAAAPLHAQTNVALGKTVTQIAGTAASGAALSTLVDNGFVPDMQVWTQGSVYWNGTTPTFLIDLGGSYSIAGILAQVDNNDTYRLEFRNPTTGLFGNAFDFSPIDATGLRIFPTPGNTSDVYQLASPVLANAVRFSAISGDNSYSATEIQLFAASTPSSVPEPATVGLLATGLLGLGTIARRRRRSA